MTVSTEDRVAGQFIGNDVTTKLPFDFRVFDENDILVVEDNIAEGTQRNLYLTTHFRADINTNQDNNPGGELTLNEPIATGLRISITTDLDYVQEVVLTNQGGFFPKVISNALDRAVVLIQQLRDITNRSLTFPFGDVSATELPSSALRSNNTLAFDDDGAIAVGPAVSVINDLKGEVDNVQSLRDEMFVLFGTGTADGEVVYESLVDRLIPILELIPVVDYPSYFGRSFRVNSFNSSTPEVQAIWQSSTTQHPAGTFTVGFQDDGKYVVDMIDNVQMVLENVTAILKPGMFGVLVDTVSQQDALQRAAYASVGKTMDWSISPNSKFITNGPVYIPSDINWFGNCTVENQNIAGDINSVVFMPGGFHPSYFDDYTYHDIDSVDNGNEITMSTPGDASLFVPGDLVWVVSDATYQGNISNQPIFGQLAEVKTSTINGGAFGVVTLDSSISEDAITKHGNIKMCLAEDDSVADLLGNPLQFCRNSKIEGLNVVSMSAGFLQRGGMYKCDFKFGEVESKNMVFANAFCRTSVSIQTALCVRKLVDIAGNSHDFNINIDNVSYAYDVAVSESVSFIRTGEGSRDGSINLGQVNAAGFGFAESLIAINSGSQRIGVNVDYIYAPDHTGTPFLISQSVNTGTQQVVEDCFINVENARFGSNVSRAALISSVAGDPFIQRCGFKTLKVSEGTFSTGYAAEINGQKSYINANCHVGALRIPSSASGVVARGYFEDGVSDASQGSNDILISSSATVAAAIGNTRQNVLTATTGISGTPLLEVPFPASSLEAGDRWRVNFRGEKVGTEGDANIRFGDSIPNRIDFNFASAAQGEFHGFIDVIFQSNARFTIYGELNFEGASTILDEIALGIDLTSITTLSFEAWKSGSGDTLRFHSLDSKVSKPFSH